MRIFSNNKYYHQHCFRSVERLAQQTKYRATSQKLRLQRRAIIIAMMFYVRAMIAFRLTIVERHTKISQSIENARTTIEKAHAVRLMYDRVIRER